ncbi:FadR/GntR family transcriptional regulator [Corallococcus sp. CA054B]|uniref:FadR/GntR family transcriptional regulator n=1 Tax=Corallococcus sp. CA054B TaxID=2316734 RepID=UPI00351A2210
MAYVEAQIERDIALGRLHPSGQFGPEAKLAQRYGASRGTIREALRRLAARGLVVQHPGRRTRAVALDESLTLENLGLALHDARSPKARWLLEGCFSLKRQVLVDLLADCCEGGSDLDLDRLRSTCFQLQDAARWESGATCAQVEFELLRQAARVAARPGHVLLVQSLQRAFLGGAAQLLPLLGGEALREWAFHVMEILRVRDVQALRHDLPAMLKACDERVLNAFAPAPPAPHVPSSPEAYLTQEGLLGASASVTGPEDAPPARPCVEERGASAPAAATTQAVALEARPSVEERAADTTAQLEALDARPCIEAHGADNFASAIAQDDSPEALHGGERHGLGASSPINEPDGTLDLCRNVDSHGLCSLAPIAEDTESLGIAPCLGAQALRVDPDRRQLLSSAAPGGTPCGAGGACVRRDVMGAARGNLSDSQTGFGASAQEGASSSPRLHAVVPAEASSGRFATWVRRCMDLWVSRGHWTVRFWRSIAHSPGSPAS